MWNDSMQEATSEIFDELIDEMTLSVAFEMHRMVKLDLYVLDPELWQHFHGDEKGDTPPSALDNEESVSNDFMPQPTSTSSEVDVFGQSTSLKKQYECTCPNCKRSLAASRFAPHLEKCIGMGRNSSRLASRRIAAGASSSSCSAGGGTANSDDDDDDWTMSSDRRNKQKRRDKNSPRRPKIPRTKNGDVSSSTGGTSSRPNSPTGPVSSYEHMSMDDRRALLVQICGVISEHTRKMCTRSLRCPQHSDDQRRALRMSVLMETTPDSSTNGNDNIHVDVDSLEDLDNPLLRAWESNTSSPADSTSTSNSSSSSKKPESKSSSSSHNGKGNKRKHSQKTGKPQTASFFDGSNH